MQYPFAEKYDASGYIILNSNINPFGPSPLAIKAISENISKVNTYPSREEHQKVKKQLVIKLKEENINVNENQIVLGNGSDEVIEFFIKFGIQKFGKPKVIVGDRTFAFYEYCARSYGLDVIKVPLKDFGYDTEKIIETAKKNNPCLIMICNPINPTGKIIPQKELEDFINEIPQDSFLLSDEAYFEFAFYLNGKDWRGNDYRSVLQLNIKKPVFVSRTFSKAYGLAGLRLGYLICDFSEEIENNISPPFNVNYLAIKAGEKAILDKDFLHKTLENNHNGLRILESIEGAIPSWGNFILIKVKKKDTYNELKNNRILVRNMEQYGFEGFIRVSVGRIEELETFRKTFGKILN